MAITMMTKSKAKASDQKNNNNKQPQTTMRNAKDVSRIIIDKRNKIIECFEKVVELCHVQITRAAENNFTHCIFEVPEFILGYPMYDINECIVHVLKRLKENEYNVSYFFPKIIYVMWPIEENKDDKQYKELLQILNNNSFGFSSAHRNQNETTGMMKYYPDINQSHQSNHLKIENPSSPYLQKFQHSQHPQHDIDQYFYNLSNGPQNQNNSRRMRQTGQKNVNDYKTLLQDQENNHIKKVLDWDTDAIANDSNNSNDSRNRKKDIIDNLETHTIAPIEKPNDFDNDKEKEKEPSIGTRTKTRTKRTKKEAKPLSEFKTNNRFVLDLS